MQGIDHSQARKSGEIPVGRAECGAMLDGQSREMRVHHEWPAGLSGGEQIAQDLPMTLAGAEDTHHRSFEPSRDDAHRFFGSEGVGKNAGIRPNAKKSQERHPREPDSFVTRKDFFQPASRGVMALGRCIVSV